MEKKKHSSLLLRKQTTCDNQTFPSDKATDIFVSLGAPYLRLCAKAKPCLVNWNGYFFTKIKKKRYNPNFQEQRSLCLISSLKYNTVQAEHYFSLFQNTNLGKHFNFKDFSSFTRVSFTDILRPYSFMLHIKKRRLFS